jgi:periplasmic divalent cation tolerance protein
VDLPAGPSRTGISNDPSVTEQFVIAFSTFPDAETARTIARELVDSALVACVNIIPAVESIYYWKEKVETSAESLAIFKLTAAHYSEFESRLRALHPYDVPEVVRLNISGGSADYLRWIGESCSRSLTRARP